MKLEEAEEILYDAMFELGWLANLIDPQKKNPEFDDARKLCDRYEKMKKETSE
jgi:hypothetical protein